MKSGWGALAGGYAVARGTAGVTRGARNSLKGLSSQGKSAALTGAGGVAGMVKGVRSAGNEQTQQREGVKKDTSQGPSAETRERNKNPENQKVTGNHTVLFFFLLGGGAGVVCFI